MQLTGLSGDHDERGSRVRALRRRMPPQNQLPVRVNLTQVIHQDDRIAVGLVVEAFTTGLRLTLLVRLAQRPTRLPDHLPISVRRQAERISGDFNAGDRKLHVGVVLADGRRLVGTEQLHFLHDDAALRTDTAILVHLGDRGDGPLSVDATYWLTPLPPPGSLVLAFDGTDLGLHPTMVPIDGSAIALAVTQTKALWPSGDDEPIR